VASDQGYGRNAQAGAQDHEENRAESDIRGQADFYSGQGQRAVSVAPSREEYMAVRSGLGDRLRLHPAFRRLCLPGSHNRPLFAEGAVLARLVYHRRRVLRLSSRGGNRNLGPACDL
jgi:hypothetical protein